MNATQEEWRPVVGHEGSYEVSNLGRVRSIDRIINYPNGRSRNVKGRLLSPGRAARGGHRYVNLGRNNSRYVHHLVAEAFIGPRPERHEVCHNNGDPEDNRAINLRYDTRLGNCLDMIHHGTQWNSRKTQCPSGHDYDESNTYWRPTGGRQCRKCVRDANRRSKARKKAQRAA